MTIITRHSAWCCGTLAKLNIGNYIVEQTRKKINSNNFLELAVKKIG